MRALSLAATVLVVAVGALLLVTGGSEDGPVVGLVAAESPPATVMPSSTPATVMTPSTPATVMTPSTPIPPTATRIPLVPTPIPVVPTPIPVVPTPVPRTAVTFAFGGDVHFEGSLRQAVIDAPHEALSVLAPLFEPADLAMVNLETAVTDRGQPEQKQYVFRSPIDGLTALQAAGVDLVTNANNHTLDFGRDGLDDTLAAADAVGMGLVGVGPDQATAYAPWTSTINETSIAVFGASQVLDGFATNTWPAAEDRAGLASAQAGYVDLLLENVRAAARERDVVVVYLHWGIEANACPSSSQVTLAGELARAGADIIVGSHAHELQGMGLLGDTFVAYGLGNLVFQSKPEQLNSGVLHVTVHPDERIEAQLHPARLRGSIAQPLDGNDRAWALESFATLQPCTGLQPSPEMIEQPE